MKILVYGYGNPGRQDDGLGIFFSEEIEKWAAEKGYKNIDCDSNYQLNAEDAVDVIEHEVTLFADAAHEQQEPFKIKKLKAGESIAFSTHALTPESVLAVCNELYSKNPDAWIITIKAEKWGVNEPMTQGAKGNLKAALEFIKPVLMDPKGFGNFGF